MTPLCTTRPDLDWFSPADYPAAREVCGRCELARSCEAGARARGEQHGLWAGIVFDPDDAMVVAGAGDVPEPVAVAVEHGTRARHNTCRDGDDGGACRRCREVHAAYVRAWRESRGAVSQRVDAGAEQLVIEGMSA